MIHTPIMQTKCMLMVVVLKLHINMSKIMWNMLYEVRYEQSYIPS